MFLGIGMWTWAVILLMILMVVMGSLMNRGVITRIVAIVIFAFAVGGMMSIIFPKGYQFPLTNLRIGVAVVLVVLFLGGIGLFSNSGQEGSHASSSFREKIPQLNAQRMIGIVAGGILVAVTFSVAIGSMDVRFENSERGLKVATKQFKQQGEPMMRKIERFLAE